MTSSSLLTALTVRDAQLPGITIAALALAVGVSAGIVVEAAIRLQQARRSRR